MKYPYQAEWLPEGFSMINLFVNLLMVSTGAFANTDVITVTNLDHQPIANAQVLIGDAMNSAFAGNFLTTDAAGHVTVPAEWTANASITVQATGFVRATYLNQAPHSMTIALRSQKQMTKKFEIKGTALDLRPFKGDGAVDFGWVIAAFTKSDLTNFDLGNILSPQRDALDTIGTDLQIPSNFSIPTQQETYKSPGFPPTTLNFGKPLYRSYQNQPGPKRFVSLQGRFSLNDAIEILNKEQKPFFELVNKMSLLGAGVMDLNVQNESAQLDIPSTKFSLYSDGRSVTVPTIARYEKFMAIAAINQSGYLIPTDIKFSDKNDSVRLKTIYNEVPLVLGIVKSESDWKSGKSDMRLTLMPLTDRTPMVMLPNINPPTIAGPYEIAFQKISPVAGVNALATYSVISSADLDWEIYANKWVTGMKLPNWPYQASGSGKKNWSVSFIGSVTASDVELGPAMTEAATHVTRSSIDY
jgi:hypothetical protein